MSCCYCHKRKVNKKYDSQYCTYCYTELNHPKKFIRNNRRKLKKITYEKLIEQGGFCFYCKIPLYTWERIQPFLIRKRFNYCEVTKDCDFAILLDGIRVAYHVSADHVKPISKGGAILDKNNIVACCELCNRNKGDRI